MFSLSCRPCRRARRLRRVVLGLGANDDVAQFTEHAGHAFAGDGGDLVGRAPCRLLQRPDLLGAFLRIDHVDLAQRHNLGLVGNPVAVGLEFMADGLVGLGDIFLQ
jgi:hypothetical protein